jgi:hypothetical protein
MPNTLKHKFVSAKPADSDTSLIRSTDWNDEHAFSGGSAGYILVRDTGQTDGGRFLPPDAVNVKHPPYNAVGNGVADDTAAITAAIESGANKIIIPEGTYNIASTLTIDHPLNLVGAGIERTKLRRTATNTPLIQCTSLGVLLRDFSLTSSVTPVLGGDGIVVNVASGGNHNYLQNILVEGQWRGFVLGSAAFARADNIIAQNNNSHGIEFMYLPSIACQWQVYGALSQLNMGAGYYARNATNTHQVGPFLDSPHSFGNALGGYFFQGANASSTISDLFLIRPVSSIDNYVGITLDTRGGGHVILSPWVESAGLTDLSVAGWPNTQVIAPAGTGYGISLLNNSAGLVILNPFVWTCGTNGITIESTSPHTTILGGTIRDNNLRLGSDPLQTTGVFVNAAGTMIQGVTFGTPGAQTSYIRLAEVLANVQIGVNSYHPSLGSSAWVAGGAVTPARFVRGIGVGNSQDATTLGSVVKKIEIFDSTGCSLGFIPVYNTIS